MIGGYFFEVVNLACWAYAVGEGRDRPTPVGAVIDIAKFDGEVFTRVVEVAVDRRDHAVEMLRDVPGLDRVQPSNVRDTIELQCASVLAVLVRDVDEQRDGSKLAPFGVVKAIETFKLDRVLAARSVLMHTGPVWVSVGGGARGTGRVGLENAAASSAAEPVVASP